jgi:hypothetical protein
MEIMDPLAGKERNMPGAKSSGLRPGRSNPTHYLAKLKLFPALLLLFVHCFQNLVSPHDGRLGEFFALAQFLDELGALKFTLVTSQCLVNGFAAFYIYDKHSKSKD